tara:strand:+ start:1510 stop:3201 length:1692 start_codon:yes stop_codon:yes gene_type:complete
MNFAYYGNKTPEPSRIIDLYNFSGNTLAVDIETISLDDRRPIGISIATSPNDAYYFPLGNHPEESVASPIIPWHLLEDSRILKVLHNANFDIQVLQEFCGHGIINYTDTMLAAQIMGTPAYDSSLYKLCSLYFGETLTQIEDLLGKKGKNQKTMESVDTATIAEKCCQDTIYTYRLWELFQGKFSKRALDLDLELMPVIREIETRGMAISTPKLLAHKEQVEREVQYYQRLCQGMGFNPGSTLQVAAVLESRGWSIRYNRKTKKPMLNEEILTTHYAEDPISWLVMNYRKQRILLSTFIKPVLERHLHNGRVFSRINLNITGTGRLSRSNPNTQNIPSSMRDIYIPTDNNVLEAWDLSQIELRALAYLVWQHTGDKTMQEVFDRGGDVHAETANFLNITRRLAKDVNFAVTFGGSAYTLQTRAGIPIVQGQALIDGYFRKYPGIKTYINMVYKQLHSTGFTETVLGRKRDFRNKLATGQPREIAAAEREAFNLPIQGSAGELLKRLMIRAKEYPQINSIHDEIVFDIDPKMVLDTSLIKDLAPYETPMSVKRGYSWGNLVEIT